MDAAAKPTMKKRACDSCYRRKIQCDREEPQCNWCKHHGLACTFNRPARLKKIAESKKEKNEKGLLERIGRLEKLLAEKVSQGGTDSPETPAESPQNRALSSPTHAFSDSQAVRLTLGPQITLPGSTVTGSSSKLHFAGIDLGEISTYNGIPFFSSGGQSWIHARTGQHAVFPLFSSQLWQNQSQIPKELMHTIKSSDLPEKAVAEEYFSNFLKSSFKLVFPIVDPVLFRRTIELAYEPSLELPSLEVARARACVLSFLSVTTLMEGTSETVPIDSDVCAIRAQQLFPQIMLDVSLTGLQIMFMQCMFHLFSGKFQTASMFHSMACRMLFMLGAHTMENDLSEEPPSGETEESWRVKCHLRKYFWMCYTFDKDISLRTWQPPAIDDGHCDLKLPKSYQASKLGVMIMDARGTTFLPGDLRLSMIKSKSIKLLYSPDALRKSDAELLRDIRELDDELESWRMSIDESYRPKLWGEVFASIPDASPSQKMHYIISNFEYHYLMATIHQATSRCRAWENGVDGEMEGVSSSLALAVEASRSTLVYLRAAVEALLGESFWMVIFYPMSAMITIFCNLLLYPLNDKAQRDLELLKEAPELIRGIRIRRMTLNEVIHMKMIEDFVAELVRLGSCAIQKARSEQKL